MSIKTKVISIFAPLIAVASALSMRRPVKIPPLPKPRRALPAFLMQTPTEQPVGYHRTLPPIRRRTTRIGRNDPCPCLSGDKYKRCECGRMAKDKQKEAANT